MKKYINLIIGALVLVFIFGSCKTDLDNISTGLKKHPGNMSVDNDIPFVCSAENGLDTAFVFSWSAADFGQDISITYVLQVDLEGNNFASPYEIVVGNNKLERGVISSELNSIMHKFGMPIDVPTDLEVRVLARPMVLGSSQPVLPQGVSESKATITVTSFARAPLHMVGTMFGSHPWMGDPSVDPFAWDATNYRYVMFRDDPLGLDIYTAQFRGSADNSLYMGAIKLIENKDLGGGPMIGKVSDGVLGAGSDIMDITATGYYTFKVDIVKMTYTVEVYDASSAIDRTSVKLVGAGVSSPVTMTQHIFNPHIWVADDVALTTNEVEFDLDGEIWSGAAFPWGMATNGGETLNVSIAGNYFVKYNNLTGHYVFYKK